MGLDQYLWAEKHVVGNKWSPQDDQNTFKALVGEIQAEGIVHPEEQFASVKVCAIYWRKANQIHKWFVDNVQDGRDDCNRHYVSDKKLAELGELCWYVTESRDVSALPPTEGFFFGSTDADEYYWAMIERTAKDLDRLLSADNRQSFEFFYESSW